MKIQLNLFYDQDHKIAKGEILKYKRVLRLCQQARCADGGIPPGIESKIKQRKKPKMVREVYVSFYRGAVLLGICLLILI